ncbi:MAG: efflux RND transporter periplasmic adaptor subunit [Gammaproteobacteria bacterium]|nr:efflux RND transporter periplasmic adaptor subunit [Gammaproteobacteria bacterium]
MKYLPLTVVLASLLATGCSESDQAPASQPFSASGLDTALIERKSVAEEIFFDGTLEALHQSTVASETNARVMEVPFDVDDRVEKGQVIVRFRNTDQSALLSRAEAALSEAQARLTNDKMEYERAEKVFAKQLVSKAQLDSLKAAYDASEARVRAAQAEVRRAKEQLEHTVIRAPYSGLVVERHIEVGETATMGQPLMTGLSLEHLRAVVDIPQNHIAPLRQHRKARVILPNGQSVEASDIRIPPTANPESHSFRVLVDLPAGELGVYPGTLIKVAFVTGSVERLTAPLQALIQRGEVTGLYVIKDNERIVFQYVRTASKTRDGLVTLVSGAQPGQRVALDPIAAAIAYRRQFELSASE